MEKEAQQPNNKQRLLNRKELIIYICVGFTGTIISLIVIFILLHIHVNYILANFLGYFVGFVTNYLMHASFTFRVKKNSKNSVKYIISIIMNYLNNLFIVIISINYLGINSKTSQMFGVLSYVILGYILNKYWVFKKDCT